MRIWGIALAISLMIGGRCYAEPFNGPPAGYFLVAEDDCGNTEMSFNVLQGNTYAFPVDLVKGDRSERDIVFDNDFVLLQFPPLNPKAAYKIEVTYVSQADAGREQSLTANGVTVHEKLVLPEGAPGQFIFDLPASAYTDGKPLELKFQREGGANAVVSLVRIWSTHNIQLSVRPILWEATGPVERDWLRQDIRRGKPGFTNWDNPEKTITDEIVPCVDEQLIRAERLLRHLQWLSAPGTEALSHELNLVISQKEKLSHEKNQQPEAWQKVYLAARWIARKLTFAHPELQAGDLLFVQRHHSSTMHQCARRQGAMSFPGGELCMLSGNLLEADVQVRSLSENLFPPGVFGRPDLSFDGKRIVVGFAPQRTSGDTILRYGAEIDAPLNATHQIGPCEAFQIWEMNLDGSNPRQLTTGPSENSDPIYLPDGRIAFMSHRAGGRVQCGDWALSYCVYSMNPDGSDVRQVTVSKDGEWDPFLLADGSIGFTRWEYAMKFWSPIQMLWSVRPDGTNPRMIYGSDLTKPDPYPLNYAAARHIEGTSKIVCVGSAHHNTGAGPLCVVDMAIGPAEVDGLSRITPVRYVETPDNLPDAGWYDCPYPLDETLFIASYTYSSDETDTTGYGLYLVDLQGNRELLYRDENLSTMFPIILKPRKAPGVLPQMAENESGATGEFLIQDVHAGLPLEMQGQARYVQIVECHERKIHTSPYAIEVGPDSGFETKTVLGTVPVAEDGSAWFKVPSGKSIFFSVLDKNFQALNTMRSVTNIQPGERTGCVGCHEGYRRVPSAKRLQATLKGLSEITPPPWGVERMDYARLLQPVLDEKCITCHDEKSKLDLTATQNQPFMGMDLPLSYYNLRKYVKHAPIFSYFLPAGSFGSRVSPVVQMLMQGHHDISLTPAQIHLLCAWIDCNAPGIGDYEAATVGLYQEKARTSLKKNREKLLAEGWDVATRRQELSDKLDANEHLACYLNCGPEAFDGDENSLQIKELVGTAYLFGATDVIAPWFNDISFNGTAVVYEVSGLQPGREYRLGFSWWDYDGSGREQAVVVTGADGVSQQVVAPTLLPAWVGKQQLPEEHIISLPASVIKSGKIKLAFTNTNAKANAVVSEVWLVEKQ